MSTLTEFTKLCFVFGLMMAQWAETCRRIFNITNTCCVIYWINYCIIAKHNGMATIKRSFYASKNSYYKLSSINKSLDINSKRHFGHVFHSDFQKVCHAVQVGMFMADRHQDSQVLQILMALQVLSSCRTFQKCLHWRLQDTSSCTKTTAYT